MAGTTHITGFRTSEELRNAAAAFQDLGYTTVQAGPSKDVVDRPAGGVQDWPFDGTKDWYILVATKDPITDPSSKADADA